MSHSVKVTHATIFINGMNRPTKFLFCSCCYTIRLYFLYSDYLVKVCLSLPGGFAYVPYCYVKVASELKAFILRVKDMCSLFYQWNSSC